LKTHRLTEAYVQAFQSFLKHTTEKQDLFAVLERRIKAAKAHSLLDIGAGNGDLALPLSRLVQAYIAIEPNPEYAARLQAKGIMMVFQEPFPWKTFSTLAVDIVLASHVVPWDRGEAQAFLRASWRSLGPKGTLIMISYDEEVGGWRELLDASGLPLETVGQGRFEEYKQLLTTFGRLEIEAITTSVITKSLDEMLLALSFVYSDGQPEKAEAFQKNVVVRHFLESYHHPDEHYRFPFTHYLLQVNKAR